MCPRCPEVLPVLRFLLLSFVLIGAGVAAFLLTRDGDVDVDPVSGFPREFPGEFHSPVTPNGPWIAHSADHLIVMLICQDGTRVPLNYCNRFCLAPANAPPDLPRFDPAHF